MVQISIALFGLYFIWEGAKGFRKCGIKFGLTKAMDEPLTGSKGQVVGSIVIGLGVAVIGFAIFIWPMIMTL